MLANKNGISTFSFSENSGSSAVFSPEKESLESLPTSFPPEYTPQPCKVVINNCPPGRNKSGRRRRRRISSGRRQMGYRPEWRKFPISSRIYCASPCSKKVRLRSISDQSYTLTGSPFPHQVVLPELDHFLSTRWLHQ